MEGMSLALPILECLVSVGCTYAEEKKLSRLSVERQFSKHYVTLVVLTIWHPHDLTFPPPNGRYSAEASATCKARVLIIVKNVTIQRRGKHNVQGQGTYYR